MKLISILISIVFSILILGFRPMPVHKLQAEINLRKQLDSATTDSAKIRIAKEFLQKFPDDIAAGRMAQDLLLKKMDDPLAFFKERMMQLQTTAAEYLYGRSSQDSIIMAETAAKLLEENPGSFWGHELAGYAEWYKSKPDTAVLIHEFKAAIDADPSRPEAYLYLGWVYWDEEMWPQAREVLEAGAFVDVSDHFFRDALLTVYAEQRDGFKYFLLMKDLFPVTPLAADLPRANGGPNLTSVDLQGEPTVIEYWAYT